MATDSSQPKGRDGVLALLNGAIEALNLAKEISSVTPAKAVFGTAGVLLGLIRVCFSALEGGQLVHGSTGLDGERTRFCRAWAILR